MDDWALFVTASDLAKSIEQWDWNGIEQVEPSFWEIDDYANAAALAQQLLAEEYEILWRRRQTRRKRAANRET